jgi:hypothetical protein
MPTRGRTDDDGGYELRMPRALPAVTITVHIDAEPAERTVAPGATGVDFVLPLVGELRYRVRAGDRLVARAQATLIRDGPNGIRPHHAHDAPDPDGYRRLSAPHGDWDLLVTAPGFAPVRRPVTIGEHTAIDVELAPGVSITLRLASDAPAPAEPLHVQLVDQVLGERLREYTPAMRLADRAVVLDHTGAAIHHVAAGRHRLRLVANDDLELVPAAVEVTTADVTVELRFRRRDGK